MESLRSVSGEELCEPVRPIELLLSEKGIKSDVDLKYFLLQLSRIRAARDNRKVHKASAGTASLLL